MFKSWNTRVMRETSKEISRQSEESKVKSLKTPLREKTATLQTKARKTRHFRERMIAKKQCFLFRKELEIREKK